jgi:hypothetical protein
MSSFVVGTTTGSFTVNMDGFSEQRPTLLRTWDFEAILTLSTDYTTLNSLFSYPVNVRTAPGSAGATMYIDVGGGAGKGTLTLDNVVGSPFTAILTRISRPSAYPSGSRRVRVTFQESP